MPVLSVLLSTVTPHYNEVSWCREKCLLLWGLCYSEDPTIMNYLVNNKNICYTVATKLNNGIYTTQNSLQTKSLSQLCVNTFK